MEVTQLAVRNDDLAGEQKLKTRVLNQRVGEWTGNKGNDLQGRHKVYNKTFASNSEDFWRYKLTNKYGKHLRKFEM